MGDLFFGGVGVFGERRPKYDGPLFLFWLFTYIHASLHTTCILILRGENQ